LVQQGDPLGRRRSVAIVFIAATTLSLLLRLRTSTIFAGIFGTISGIGAGMAESGALRGFAANFVSLLILQVK